MSRVRRLSIQGIRNFGSEDEDSMICFSRPLTLILGANGTGKTTVIEALKYATTGDFPPGADKGKCFVHDPCFSPTGVVKGIVKAEVLDVKGNAYTICRAIESIRTNTTCKFKTLDSALTRINKDTKEKVSITNRCANVDTEIALAMGVSKPILNYVIFCHQDDLNWPFDDGKKLKEKFDEIFDTARYNKALEAIMKIIKESQEEVRVLKAEKEALNVIVAEVENTESKVTETQNRLKNAKEKVEEMARELQPLKDKILKIQKADLDYKSLSVMEEKKRLEYDLSKKQYDELRESISEIFYGTVEELDAQIRSYGHNLQKKNDEIKKLEEKIQVINMEESQVTNSIAEQQVTVGTLKQQVEDHAKRILDRNKILNNALSNWQLGTLKSRVCELEVKDLTKQLEGKMRTLECKVEKDRISIEHREKELQAEIDGFLSKKSQVEMEMSLRNEELFETNKELHRIQMEIAEIGTGAKQLNIIESQLNKANENVDRLNKSFDPDILKSQIQNEVLLRDKLERNLNLIDEKIASLLKQSSLQAELECHKCSLFSKEEELVDIKNKHENDIKTLLDVNEVPKKKLKDKMNLVQQKLVDTIKNIGEELQKEQYQFASLKATIEHRKHDLNDKLSQLERDKGKISSFCHYSEFDEKLLSQYRKVKDLQDKRGMYAYQEVAYKEYLKQLKGKDPCCPLCQRDFRKEDSLDRLIMQMETDMRDYPNRLKQCEIDLKMQQARYDCMQQLKATVEKVIQLEKVELKKLKGELEQSQNSLSQSQKKIQELEQSKLKPEQDLNLCKNIMGDIALWDRCLDDLQSLHEIINNIQKQMIGGVSDSSVQEVQAQRESLNESLKDKREFIEHLQIKLNVHNENLQCARNERNELHEQFLKIRSDMQNLKQIQDKHNEFSSRKIVLVELLEDFKEKLITATTELNAAQQVLDKTKRDNQQKQESDRKLIIDGNKELFQLRNIQNTIDEYIRRKVQDTLELHELNIINYGKTLTKLHSKRSELSDAVNVLKEGMSCEEVRKRELTDNIVLRKIENCMSKLREECAQLRRQLGSTNHKDLMEECNRIQQREQILIREKNIAQGKEEELERALRLYNEELKKETYRLARQNHKRKFIELTVKEEVIINLKAYCKALDIAMIKCHRDRMETVNKVIKRMWKLVYTGKDTTSIHIRTEATVGVGNSRRTYNYKLVQVKHGHEMDMRGRCSAGQKVLASILIRLALAETFCKNCGVLALDEPTTSLDEANANSLAEALATVVQLRSQQKGFQLIVITHDENFLFKLAKLNETKRYHELYRKHSGLSGIRIRAVDGSAVLVKDEILLSSDEELNDEASSSTRGKKRSSDDTRLNRASKKRFVLT